MVLAERRSPERRRGGSRLGRAGLSAVVRLSELDRRLLGLVSSQRVLSQTQLRRLLPEVPLRTLRYRTRRLCELGLLGRSRPYRERGSAPLHFWPTRRGDALVRGEPPPRGGERLEPNLLFLAHTAALSELYVALITGAGEAGMELRGFWREGQAREAFPARDGKRRALAPDALLVVVDERGRELRGFVELDMGSMSHRRLRAKAALYASYARVDAWQRRHPFCPALLSLTTGDQRSARFLRALAAALKQHRGLYGELAAGACGAAHDPATALTDDCWLDLTVARWLTLRDVLEQARAPFEREQAERAARERTEAERRRRLLGDMDALRGHLREHRFTVERVLRPLGQTAQHALLRMIDSTAPMSVAERAALAALAGLLGDDVLDLAPVAELEPREEDRLALAALIDHYRTGQRDHVQTLVRRYCELPVLRRAGERIDHGELLDDYIADTLASDAQSQAEAREKQHQRRRAYLEFREREARRLAREQGLLRRFTAPTEELMAEVDRRWLKVCPRCRELAYPTTQVMANPAALSDRGTLRCHYCHGYSLDDLTPPWRERLIDGRATGARETA
jgi:hypothetical protein